MDGNMSLSMEQLLALSKEFSSRDVRLKEMELKHRMEVNRLIREKKLSSVSCMKPLWQVMTTHGLYGKQYNTWNAQVKK